MIIFEKRLINNSQTNTSNPLLILFTAIGSSEQWLFITLFLKYLKDYNFNECMPFYMSNCVSIIKYFSI